MTFLSQSSYIRNLAIVVIAYGMSINIVEVRLNHYNHLIVIYNGSVVKT